jgi:hypothetical protein
VRVVPRIELLLPCGGKHEAIPGVGSTSSPRELHLLHSHQASTHEVIENSFRLGIRRASAAMRGHSVRDNRYSVAPGRALRGTQRYGSGIDRQYRVSDYLTRECGCRSAIGKSVASSSVL